MPAIAPKPTPRALLIAALAHASLLVGSIRPAAEPDLRPLAPTYRDRRGRALKRLISDLGRAFIEAGRARQAFEQRGSMIEAKTVSIRIDTRIKALIDCAAIAQAIGKLSHVDDRVSPWCEFAMEPAPRMTIFWRGTHIPGDELTRKYVTGADGLDRIVAGGGAREDSEREFSPERFGEALKAARAALKAAGFPPSSFVDAKWVRMPNFEGYIGTIGLLRQRPIWMQPPTPSRGRSL